MGDVVDDRRQRLNALAFWLLAAGGLALVALSVLATPYLQRRDIRRRLAEEEAKVRQVQEVAEVLEVERQALRDDPRYLARRIRQDLGYRRSDERLLPDLGEAASRSLATELPVEEPTTHLVSLCRIFSRPTVKHASLAGGLLMLAVAVVWFDLPLAARRRDLAEDNEA